MPDGGTQASRAASFFVFNEQLSTTGIQAGGPAHRPEGRSVKPESDLR